MKQTVLRLCVVFLTLFGIFLILPLMVLAFAFIFAGYQATPFDFLRILMAFFMGLVLNFISFVIFNEADL